MSDTLYRVCVVSDEHGRELGRSTVWAGDPICDGGRHRHPVCENEFWEVVPGEPMTEAEVSQYFHDYWAEIERVQAEIDAWHKARIEAHEAALQAEIEAQK